MDMKKLLESMSQFEGSEMDRSPGSPYDRGGADADYDRSPRPHKMVSNQQGGKDMVKLTDPKEIEEYMAGYEDGEKSKGKQSYDDDLDEGTGMAQLYKDEFEDHMHAEHSARAEGDDEAAREHLEAAEEAAENYHNITGQKLVSHDYDGDSPYITNPDVGNDYSDFDDEDDDLYEGTGMAQLYKDEFEDHMHAEHSARAEGDDEAAREHLEAAEEAAENYHNITGQKLVSHDYDGDSPYITNPDVGNDYGDFDDEDDDDLYEGIVGSMKKFRNALKIPTGAKKFPGAEIPARFINAKQRGDTAAALKKLRNVGNNPDSTASDFGRAVTDYGQRRDNMTGRGEAGLDEKAINPNAVGMAKAKEMYGYGDKPAHDLPKKVIKKAHEIAKKVDESLTVTATDNDAYSLMRMVSLAGVPGAEKVEPMEPYSPYTKPVTGVIYNGGSTGCSAVNCSDSNCPTHGHDMMPMEEYANEPDESTCEVSSVTDKAGLGGLNGPKSQHPYAANRSDNPLDEVDIAERVTKLAGMYNKIKGK